MTCDFSLQQFWFLLLQFLTSSSSPNDITKVNAMKQIVFFEIQFSKFLKFSHYYILYFYECYFITAEYNKMEISSVYIRISLIK